MKEDVELYSEMSLTRLEQLRRVWVSQIMWADHNGDTANAERLRRRKRLVEQQIDLRKNENLNDLFG